MRFLSTILTLFLAVFATAAATYTVDEVPNVHVADSSAYVCDPDGILSAQATAEINSLMRGIRRTTSAEPMVVIVDNIDPDDIDIFATELFEHWGLGKSDVDNGLLVLVAKDLRRAAIRPGYGLEGVLPDIVCAGILKNRMFPEFRNGDYSAGLVAASQAISSILTDPEAAAEFRSEQEDADFAAGRGEDVNFFRVYLIIACVIARSEEPHV